MEDTSCLTQGQREEIKEIINLAIVSFKVSIQKELALLTQLVGNPAVCANLKFDPESETPKTQPQQQPQGQDPAEPKAKETPATARLTKSRRTVDARPMTAREHNKSAKKEEKKSPSRSSTNVSRKPFTSAKKTPKPAKAEDKGKALGAKEEKKGRVAVRKVGKKKPDPEEEERIRAEEEARKAREEEERLRKEKEEREAKERAEAIIKGLVPTRIPSPKREAKV